MRLLALTAAAFLLAGCLSSDGPQPPAAADPPVDAQANERRTTADDAPAVEVLLDIAVSFELNDPLPPAAFALPANATGVRARYDVQSSGACEAVVGEPGADAAQGAWMEFVPPRGDPLRVDGLGGQLCQAVQPRPSFAGDVDLPVEPGEWTVRFGGRGISAWLELVVEATPAPTA